MSTILKFGFNTFIYQGNINMILLLNEHMQFFYFPFIKEF